MASLNHVVLTGNLTRDAELKFTGSGLPILKFSIAVNRSVKKDDSWQEEASFFDAVVIGKRGEAIHKYMTKGKMVGIEGQLRQDRWEQDGQKRSRVEIVVNEIQFLGGRSTGSAQGGSDFVEDTEGYAPRSGGGGGGGKPAAQPAGDEFEDDIPF